MDEVTLNDLLECSVCLERLDTSSKVLPCQHTFCRKCLEEIVHKHKELRCPECRILVNPKIDDLPPNVLLMRILEGMKNAVPKKGQRNVRGVQQNNIVQQSPQCTPVHQVNHGTPDHRTISNKQQTTHLIHHQPYAKALYDYAAKQNGDLTFKRGDTIILRKRIDNNWYHGECNGKEGVFPLSYVQIITPVPSHLPQCKALYDFRMNNDEEEGCLTFNKGDVITVIRRVDENWAEGKLDGKIGIFPLAFVELNNLARSLMKLSTNTQPGPSKLAPPTPTNEDSTPLIPTDHTRTVISQPQGAHQQIGFPTSDSSSTISSGGSSSTTTPNVSSSNNSSSPSTPSSPASPPPRTHLPTRTTNTQKPDILSSNPTSTSNTPQRAPAQQHGKEKRHSFTSLNSHQSTASNHRLSAEIVNSNVLSPRHGTSNEVQLPSAYIALFPYKPQKPDELELRKGGIYMVTERCQDGWYKGTSNRTQKCGVFPGNYVTLARGVTVNQSDNKTVSFTKSGKSLSTKSCSVPPELPPRSFSPSTATNTISSSWHGQQDTSGITLGRSSSAIMSSSVSTPQNSSSVVAKASSATTTDKPKERKEKGTVSLMKRLASIKRPKSPPTSSYSMDNPVFEDTVSSTTGSHPVHVRSGSCPSQLLQLQPSEHHRMFGSASQRVKHKERPSVLTHRPSENPSSSSNSSPDVHHHRKSNSLDAGNKTKSNTQTVRERFRCIAPYPPNSEYELELHVNDIIYVHKKRDDGWYKGTQQRTGKTGLFPASFVEGF